MDCGETRRMIEAYADGELEAPADGAVTEHLQHCADCAGAEKALLALRTASRALRLTPPPEFVDRVRTSLQVDVRNRHDRSLKIWRITALAACVVAAASIVFAITRSSGRRASYALADEIVSSHVRSLLADHLLDVTSSDQHTVKPWFTGKVDFAVDVRDFSEQEFPLLGGRVDYLDHRQVVALVYGHRKHVINAFVWPQAADAAATPHLRQGYHIASWRDGEMNWVLVSDAGEDVLASLQRLLQSHDAAR